MDGGTPRGRVDGKLVEAAIARRARLVDQFEAIDVLDRTLEEAYFANAGRMRMQGPARKVLATAWGKTLKSFDSIRILCEAGFGEDGLILVRSLVNLTIDVAYIFHGPDPDERARHYVANGRVAHRDLLLQFGPLPAGWDKGADWPALEERANRWKGVKIAQRARDAGLSDLYEKTYRFGSSFEHSDAASLVTYFGASDEDNQEINCHPSDDFVNLVLASTFQAMSVFSAILFGGFGLPEKERLGTLAAVFANLGRRS